ncbi:tyrosine-type recombinase/integrase [Arcobacter sp. FWKO B]|uniref:tyrosine-type recombinase/integrase n=1 Tax=Arcobacter sp. FWKO B TaxID=2593672 RepID=UPI0018A43916|nr:tyrosine-type recombinase/integrase [Arcobacter sp. FWKO B]QOG11426.1 tyrosine-type recombinase/integrase [Arcobacter sp. FWKO B]
MKNLNKEYRYYRKAIPEQYREQLGLTEYKVSLKDINKNHRIHVKSTFELIFEKLFNNVDEFISVNGDLKEYLNIEFMHMQFKLYGINYPILDKYIEVKEKESKLITLKQCRELYEKYKNKPLSANYKSYYKKLIEHFGEDFNIQDLSEDNLYTFKNEALGNLNSGTYNQHITLYSNIIEELINKKKLIDNPFTILNRADYNPIIEGFTNEEVEKLIANASGDIKTAIITQAFTGARIGEVLNIKIGDIDTEKHSININIENTTTKNHKRDIPIHLELQKYLYPLIKNLNKGDYLLKPKNRREHTINTYIKNTLNGKKTSHSFKHAFVQKLQTKQKRDENGIYIKVLAAHSINDITYKTYGKGSINWDILVSIIARLDYKVA